MERVIDPERTDEEKFGNNAAFTCPVCSKVFIVSGFLNNGERRCPGCKQSIARFRDNVATIEWPD